MAAQQLAQCGFPLPVAARLAADTRYDLHALIELVERGCPPELAVRILALLSRTRARHERPPFGYHREGGAARVANLRRGPTPASPLDPESHAWLRDLRAEGGSKDEAIARLHALLVRAARFEVARRRLALPHLRGDELDDIALEAADDALMSVLRSLDDFRGASRFTTWVYKFALLEAAVKLRKRAWQGREMPLEPETWNLFASAEPRAGRGSRAARAPGHAATCDRRGSDAAPTACARRLALNGVPIDVLAERLGTTRGALYKTLHDARRKLRRHLHDSGLCPRILEEAD